MHMIKHYLPCGRHVNVCFDHQDSISNKGLLDVMVVTESTKSICNLQDLMTYMIYIQSSKIDGAPPAEHATFH